MHTSNQFHSPHRPDSPLTDNPGMIADPARLLAFYSLAAPHTPSSSVAHHLSSLTVATPAPKSYLPDYHLRPDYAQQLSVLDNGPKNDQEKVWLDIQRKLALMALHNYDRTDPPIQAPQPIPNPYPYQLPQNDFASSLLQSYPLPAYVYADPYAYTPSTSPPSPSSSAAFFDAFLNQALTSMASHSQSTPVNMGYPNGRRHSELSGVVSSSPSTIFSESTPTKLSKTAPFQSSPLTTHFSNSSSGSSHPARFPPPLAVPLLKPSLKRKLPQASSVPKPPPVSSDPLGEYDYDTTLHIDPPRSSTLTPIKSSYPCSSRAETEKDEAGAHEENTEADMDMLDEENVPTPKKIKFSKGGVSNRRIDELANSRGSGMSTGGKDDRDFRKKLVELIEDIFESFDSIPYPVPSTYLSRFSSSNRVKTTPRTSTHPFFGRLSSNVNPQPLVNPATLKKITKLSNVVGKSSGDWWGSELDKGGSEKLMMLLRKSLEEEVENGAVWESKEAEKRPGSTKTRKPRAPSPVVEDDVLDMSSTPPREEDEDEEKEEKKFGLAACLGRLEIALEASLAVDSCLVIWAGKNVPKQLYSEELIGLCLTVMKQLLVQVVYPYIEGLSDLSDPPELLAELFKATPQVSQPFVSLISQINQTLSLTFQHLRDLINCPDVTMSDDIVIQVVYLAIGPFFITEPQAVGKGKEKVLKGKAEDAVSDAAGSKSLKGLRLDALGLLRAVFGKHESQRNWVIQEVLTSLIKLPDVKKSQRQFSLRDGRSIHIVSALLLQLIQTCTHTVKEDVLRIRNRANTRIIMDEDTKRQPEEGVDKEVSSLYISGNEAAVKSAKTIALFLVNTTASSKATKTSDAEHRAVLDMVLHDLVTVLFWPEWPGASLLLTWFCKSMIASLSDEKTSAEDNASKAIALDHLGLIGARLRTSSLHALARAKKAGKGDVGGAIPLSEIVSKLDSSQLARLSSLQSQVINYLGRSATADPSLASSYEHSTTIWGHELSSELTKLVSAASEEGPVGTPRKDNNRSAATANMTAALQGCLNALWDNEEGSDVFSVGNPPDVATMDTVSEEINNTRSFSNALDSIINAILLSLNSTSVTFRTKALRALGHVLAADSTVLKQTNVRRTIETRLNDSSPAVRDVAVELLGKHLLQDPTLVERYLSLIGERVNDSGLAVRKRTIKLLKTIYSSISSVPLKIEICVKLIQRIDDEDEAVKDLAVRTIEELWFTNLADQPALNDSSLQTSVPCGIQAKTSVFIGVAGFFKERQNPIESFLVQIVSDKSKKADSKALSLIHENYQELCDALIDLLVDASDQSDFSISNCIKAVYHLCAAYPGCIYSSKASHLLPYLRSPTNAEEQAISTYLLKIFRQIVTKMPRTATTFARNLESKLLPMVNGAVGGSSGLQEIIACLCAVVNNLTHSFDRLVKLLGSCTAKLEAVQNNFKKNGKLPQNQKSICLLLFITALLGENCDFDDLRLNHPELTADIAKISKDYISEYIFRLIHSFRNLPIIPAVSRAMVQSLGFLFREYPTQMVDQTSLDLMDSVFACDDMESRAVLLYAIQDFLVAQAARVPGRAEESPEKVAVNMTELIGDTETFAESGVGSTIVQRYLMQILDAALHPQTQHIAMEILTFTVKQGLAHPIQSAPIIIALETSADPNIAARAFALHLILHHKHGSIINSRFFETARVCYGYQSKGSEGAARGYRHVIQTSSVEPVAVALLRHWYGLLRDKRPLRKEFLRYVLRPFEVDLTSSPHNLVFTSDDVGFCVYLADNLATFDYKTQEEVLVVLHYLTSIISVTGMHLFEALSNMKPLAEESSTFETQRIRVAKNFKLRKRVVVRKEDESDEESSSDESDMMDSEDGSPRKEIVHEEDESDILYPASSFANVSVIVSLAFVLKTHLKELYGLSEEKCKKFVLGAKKSAVGDKPAARQPMATVALDLGGIPNALTPVIDMRGFMAQMAAFTSIYEADGTTAEPED